MFNLNNKFFIPLLQSPENAIDYFNLAVQFHNQNQLDFAIKLWIYSVYIDPYNGKAWSNIGNVYADLDFISNSLFFYVRAVIVEPHYPSFYNNISTAYLGQNSNERAVIACQRALYIQPNFASAYTNLSGSLRSSWQHHAALLAGQKAILLDPQNENSYNNLAIALKESSKPEEAIMTWRRALLLNNYFIDAWLSLGITYLYSDQYSEGWKCYEWRLKRPDFPQMNKPRWQGEEGKGKKIFIYEKQGFGDYLLFCRYIPLVALCGFEVIFEVPKELCRLMLSLESVHTLVKEGEPYPDYDFHCPLLSLPYVFNTQIDTVPTAQSYLKVESNLRLIWKNRIDEITLNKGKKKIGLAWWGNDPERSCPLQEFVPLLSFDCYFFKIQTANENKNPIHSPLIDLMTNVQDFADTAAIIEELDLIISVDTSIAHLSGSLGKKTWLLSRFNADWRWQREGDVSRWYPQTKIFRQSSKNDWSSVIIPLSEELKIFLS